MSVYKKPEKRVMNNLFWWAVIYLGRPIAMYPRQKEAKNHVLSSNKWFEKNNSACRYSTKRYRMNFKGLEIDTYEHSFERIEAKS